MKKVVIIGPECTGKTTLTKALSNHFKTPYIKEYAREHIDNLKGNYQQDDILTIAKKQIELEDNIGSEHDFLFLDTDLIVCKVWSEFKYGHCHPWILQQIEQRHYDHYLLCKVDLKWKNDGMREHPNHRKELYAIYHNELKNYKKSFSVVSGMKRLESSLDFLQKIFSK